MRTLMLLATMGLLPGCATLWTVLEVTDSNWQQGGSSTETPAGPAEARVRVSAEYRVSVAQPQVAVAPAEPMPPAAVHLAPPRPGLVELRPVPLPPAVQMAGPPPAERIATRGALAVSCLTEERFTQVHVRRELHRYDGVWKGLTAFMFLAEATMSSAILYSTLHHDPPQVAPAVLGGVIGLDALGVAVLFWQPPQTLTRTNDAEGRWHETGRTCPAELAVETPEGPAPIAADGSVGVGAWMLGTALWAPDTSFSFRLGAARPRSWSPSTYDRCQWAHQEGADADFCRTRTYFRQSSTELVLPLDAPTAGPGERSPP